VAATDVRRWAAIASAIAASSLAPPARAADHVNGTVFYYADSDHVRVLSPSLAGTAAVGPVTASTRASVDIVSAASVDLVSAASPRGFTEQRAQVDLDAAYDLGRGRTIDGLFAVSREPDFLTYTGGAGASWDVLDRSATLGLRYAFSHSKVGRTDDAAFSRVRMQHQAEVSFSPLLSKNAVADVVYALTVVDGYQANPYRYVRLYEPGAATFATAVTERVPELRVRHAAVLRVRVRLARPLFGVGEYRAYADSWGVLAHSAMARAIVPLGPFTFTAEARAYRQTAASFYRRRYDTFPSAPDLRTADKELGPLWTALGGLHVEWGRRVGRVEALRIGVGGDYLHMRYLDNALLPSRDAGMLSVEITVEL
jgi:hypothetical protein